MRLSALLSLSLALLLSLSIGVVAGEQRHDRLRGPPSLAAPLLPAVAPLVGPLFGAEAGHVGAPDPRYKDNVTDGRVARSAVVAFNETVSAQLKEDWLNSMLYAQLSCRTTDGFTDPKALLQCVNSVLYNSLHWNDNVHASLRAAPRNASQPLAEDVLGVIEKAPSGGIAFAVNYRGLARSAVESLKVEDDAYASWHNSSTNGTRNFFHVSVASVESDHLVVWTATFHLATKAQPYQVLWSNYAQIDATLNHAVTRRHQIKLIWTDKFRQSLRDALATFLPQNIVSKDIQP